MKKHTPWIGTLLLTLALGATTSAIGFEKKAEKDNPDGRRQAMDEWYNESYADHGKAKTRGFGHKKKMFSAKYERFMRDAAKRERQRYSALMPQSGTSATMLDPQAAIAAASDGTWINIGPTKANYATNGGTLNVTDSGRINAITTDPADPNIIYIAYSGGGVWKSVDGGAFWNAKTETLGSLSVGTIEMDPNDSKVIYLGLGDTFDGTGVGMAKSDDGADTWSDPILLGDSTEIADIEIKSTDSEIVLVATNKGLYRSADGGDTYTKVTIATGQAGDPYIWTLASGGGSNFVLSLEAAPGATDSLGQIWRSTDSGASWIKSTLAAVNGRISVASAASNRNTMYALAGSTAGATNIYKSTDNGVTWSNISNTTPTGSTSKNFSNTNAESSKVNSILGGQGWYNHAIVVDPSNASIAYFGGQLLMAKTSDGGASFKQISNWVAQYSLPYVHADFHAAHIASNGTLYAGTDGGIFRSTNGGTNFTDTLNEGIASHLIYQVGSSVNKPNAVIVGLQDNGTRVRETNTSVFNQEIGGDGFGSDINQGDGTKMLGSLYYLRIQKSTDSGLNFSSACSGITECNNQTTAPFRTALSRWAGDATGNTLFTYSNTKVYKTTNYAGSWTAVGMTGVPTTPALYIRGVSAAPSSSSVIGIVANSGRVFLTTNGGTSWTAATAPTNNGSSLSWIAFDQTDRNIVYVASVAPDATKSHVWRSTDFGVTWTAIDTTASGFPGGIPVNSIVIDPITNTTLYAATHLGVYKSTDSGTRWERYGVGMPLVNVTDVYVAADGSIKRAGTFGRSVWELSDNQVPVANFTVTVSGLTATFTDTSTDADGTIASRDWNFGDRTTTSVTNPSHTFAAAGTYNVRLTVTDNKGTQNSVIKQVTVGGGNAAPVANFSFTTSNLTATFTDGSTDSDGSIASRSWNFGDSTSSTLTNPGHTYAAAGTYNVVLTVTDNSGATHAVTKSVTVTAANVAPVANFTFTSSNLTATFTDSSTDSDGTIASRSWNFGDSTSSTLTNPGHTYTAAGTYSVTLTVTDNSGGTHAVTKSVTVTAPANVAPVANFSFTTSNLTANFTDSSTDSDGTIASRSWNFGDSTTSTATNPSKAYTAAGTYSVTLTVTDNGGATHAVTKSVTVTAPPSGDVLTNGVAKTGISGISKSNQYFTLVVPAGATGLKFVTSGGTGDADLYVKFGSVPTTTVNDCKSEGGTNAETCNIATAQAGTYHVLVHAYSAISGVSLTGSYTEPSNAQTYSNTTDYTINDNATVDSPITVSGRTGNAPSNASVTVAIVHTYQGDLKVDLVAPDGTLYNIHNRTGSTTDNINKTVTLNLSSELLNGEWKLRVADMANDDVGKIDSWSITF